MNCGRLDMEGEKEKMVNKGESDGGREKGE